MPHFDNFINLLIKIVFREMPDFSANFRLFRAHASAGNVSRQEFTQPPCQFAEVTVSGRRGSSRTPHRPGALPKRRRMRYGLDPKTA